MGKKWNKSCKLVVCFHGVNEGGLTVELGGEDLNHRNESGLMSLSTFTTFRDECVTVQISVLIENNVSLSICSPSYWLTHKHIMWLTELTTTKNSQSGSRVISKVPISSIVHTSTNICFAFDMYSVMSRKLISSACSRPEMSVPHS